MTMDSKLLLAAAGLALVAWGCGAGSDASTNGTVSARVALVPGNFASASSVSLVLNDDGDGDDEDEAHERHFGPVDTSKIDSLIVTVTRVDALPDSVLQLCHPPEGDSVHGFRPGRPPEGMGDGRGPEGMNGPQGCGPHGRGNGGEDGEHPHPPFPDSLLPPDSGWGSRPWHWFSLDVVGNGRLDLLHLPAAGLTLASGSLAAGDYKAARLIVSDATIWFNTPITGIDTTIVLKADTGYTVKLPRRRGGVMAIFTNAGFTIPDGGGDVPLVFDPNTTIGRVIVADSGKIVLRPVLHPRH